MGSSGAQCQMSSHSLTSIVLMSSHEFGPALYSYLEYHSLLLHPAVVPFSMHFFTTNAISSWTARSVFPSITTVQTLLGPSKAGFP